MVDLTDKDLHSPTSKSTITKIKDAINANTAISDRAEGAGGGAPESAVELNSTTPGLVTLSSSDTSTVVISTATGDSAPVEGQLVDLLMISRTSTGSYTLAVQGGTLTFDAADEAATLRRFGSTWRVMNLHGATVV